MFGDENMPQGWEARSITRLTGATHFATLDGNGYADVFSIINERSKIQVQEPVFIFNLFLVYPLVLGCQASEACPPLRTK